MGFRKIFIINFMFKISNKIHYYKEVKYTLIHVFHIIFKIYFNPINIKHLEGGGSSSCLVCPRQIY